MRLRTYWGDEGVITKIRFLRKKGVPLYPKYVLKHYPALFSAALRIFGSWANALIAADLEVPDSPHDGPRGVLRALRDALEQHPENDLPDKLKLHAVYYFGSLRKAKAALKTDRRLRTGWSTTKIIAAIRERQRLGKPLGYAAARRDDPALVSAAEAYFGAWGNGLYGSGIDPNLYFRGKWRKRRMIAKRDHTRYGNLPSSSVSTL
jgi:AcrR family transcriptional regulator